MPVRDRIGRGWVDGPLAEVWRRTAAETTRLERLLLFAAVPAVLLLVAVLPAGVQASWTLVLDAPSLRDAYLSSVVHADPRHLWSNVFAYVFLMGVLLPLAVFAEWTRELYATCLCYLGGVPFVVAAYSIRVLRNSAAQTTVGFSGVNAALLGLVPVLLVAFLRRTVDRDIRLYHGLGLVALELAAVLFALSGPTPSAVGLAVLGGVGWAVLWWDTRGRWDAVTSNETHLLLVAAALIVFAILPFHLLVDVGPGVNVYGHFVGFVAGSLLPCGLSLAVDLHRQLRRLGARIATAR